MEKLKDRWRIVRPHVITGLAYWVLRTICATLRVRTRGFEKIQGAAIYCGWHGRSMIYANHFRGKGLWVIISQSRDGEMQAGIFRRLGYQIIRGSTGRGGVRAAVEAIRALREGGSLAMTPDGPRGPSHVVQGGVMLMAQKSGAALVPVGVAANPRFLAKSWDRYMVPMPFGKGLIVAGDPIFVPAGASEAEIETLRQRLEDEINRLEVETERELGVKQVR